MYALCSYRLSLSKHFLTPFQQEPPTQECVNTQEVKIRMNLGKLPDEIILKVLSFLPVQVIIQFAQVSRRMKEICKDYTLWNNISDWESINLCDKGAF